MTTEFFWEALLLGLLREAQKRKEKPTTLPASIDSYMSSVQNNPYAQWYILDPFKSIYEKTL